MRNFTKDERVPLKNLLKVGILRRHAEWQEELKALLEAPFTEDENEFSRSVKITDMARKFYKEAMNMEDFYRSSWIEIGIISLIRGGYLSIEELSELPEELQTYFQERLAEC